MPEPTLTDVYAELCALRTELAALRADRSTQLVDAQTLASELRVSRQWIYEHRDKLGAIRIGDGPKARLRFDVDTARHALTAPVTTTAPRPASRQTRTNRTTSAGSILKVRKD
jgi:hypothetical protein